MEPELPVLPVKQLFKYLTDSTFASNRFTTSASFSNTLSGVASIV